MPAFDRVLLAGWLVLLAACGGGGGGDEAEPAAPLRLEAAATVTQTVGPAGATLSATAGNGTRYTLEVPRGALREQVTIALTPIGAISGLPAGLSLAGGAHLAPEGQRFALPVKLTITLTAAPARPLLPFGYAGELQQRRLHPAQFAGAAIEFQILHFSGYAALINAFDELTGGQLEYFAPPSERGELALQQLVAAANGPPAQRVAGIVAALRGWLDEGIEPRVVSVQSLSEFDPDVFVLGDVAQLRSEVLLFRLALTYAVLYGASGDALGQINTEFAAAGRDAARHVIARSNAACASFSVLVIAQEILAWQGAAEAAGATAIDATLQRAAVLQALCVQPMFDASDGDGFPTGIQPGQQGLLSVRAGYSIDGGPARFDLPMLVASTGTSNLSPSQSDGAEIGAGQTYARLYQWHAGTASMRIDLLACFAMELLNELCKAAVVTRGAAGVQPAVVQVNKQASIGIHGSLNGYRDTAVTLLLDLDLNEGNGSAPLVDVLDRTLDIPSDHEVQGSFRATAQSSANSLVTDAASGVVTGTFDGRVRASCTSIVVVPPGGSRDNTRVDGYYDVSTELDTGTRDVIVALSGTLSRSGPEDLSYYGGKVSVHGGGSTTTFEISPFTAAVMPISHTFRVPKDRGFSIEIRLNAQCDIGLSYESRVNEVQVALTYVVTPD